MVFPSFPVFRHPVDYKFEDYPVRRMTVFSPIRLPILLATALQGNGKQGMTEGPLVNIFLNV